MLNTNEILYMPHHEPSEKHIRMSIYERSAQFAPFKALAGHDEQVKEAARLTDKRIEVNDELSEILNNQLNYINLHIKESPVISITYFAEDLKKEGGKYITYEGIVKKIDISNQTVIYNDNTKIKMVDILSISGELFKNFENN